MLLNTMNDIKLAKQALQSLELAMSKSGENMEKMVFELRKLNIDFEDNYNNVPLKSTKPYFRQKERY